MRLIAAVFLSLSLSFPLAGNGIFSVKQNGNDFAILYRGEVLIHSIVSSNLDLANDRAVKHSTAVMPDGTRVWNLWREDKAHRIRQEIALAADGSQVEISMKGETAPYSEKPSRLLHLAVPMKLLDGKSYHGLSVNTRFWKPRKGSFDIAQTPSGDLDKVTWRYLNISDQKKFNVVFDLNPIGAGDYTAQYSAGVIKGVWNITRQKNDLIFCCGSHLRGIGGMTGAKVVLREGVLEKDYFQHHALKSYRERGPLAVNHALSFGAKKVGREFTIADDIKFGSGKKYGWLGNVQFKRNIDSPEGIYYSSLAGKNAVFRFSGLIPGVHIFTVSAGNFGGHANKFTVSVNGKNMVRDLTVKKGQLAVTSLCAWVNKDGIADIKFDGDFLVSGIAEQCLIAQAEDFSFRRGFWVSDGYESAIMFRNQDYRPEAVFNPALELINMPIPGKEAVGKPKKLEALIELPPADAPELQWRWNANFYHLGGNSASLDEYRDPKDLKKVFDLLEADGAKAIMVNGMMSRHTYPAHIDRGLEMLGKIVKEAHSRNIKVVDHQDVTLLWNTDSGFRVMAERLPETLRTMTTMVPNGQFCLINPELTRKYQAYLKRALQAGIDGLQADESCFMPTYCGCSTCRNEFYKDTNWQLPLNELDKRLYNRNDPLWKYFLEWRKVKAGNWKVQLRRSVKKYNPYLTICGYCTHWGFMSQASSLVTAVDLTQAARAVNYLGTEVMTRNCLLSARAVLPCRRMVNLLNVAFKTPIWAWIYGGLDGEKMYEAFYAGWAMCNMTSQSAMTRWTSPPKRKTTFKNFESSADNMNRAKAQPIAQVALLFSAASRDWNRGGQMFHATMGLAQTLEELHVPYEIIGAMSLKPEVLKKYRFFSIANNGCLSDSELKVIKDYVYAGGVVHLIGGAGLQDEMGNERPVWGFADVMQFDIKRPKKRNVVYKAGFSRDPGKADKLLKTTRQFVPSIKIKRSSFFTFDQKDRPVPVFVNQRYGKGRFIYEMVPLANLLYFEEGRVNEPWRNELDVPLAEKYRRIVRKMTASAAWWQVDAPEKVYTSVYKQDKAVLVHFFNAQAANLKKGELLPMAIPADPFPALQKDITFTLPFKAVKEVYAVSPDFAGRKKLAFKTDADGCRVTVTLPKDLLKAYTIVWIK